LIIEIKNRVDYLKVLFLSDIHGNYAALEAVWLHMQKHKADIVLCAGDLVSFGPRPAEVVEFIRKKEIQSILGNHEAVIAGIVSTKDFIFKDDAERDYINNSISRTLDFLDSGHIDYIKSLHYDIVSPEHRLIMTHSVPDMFTYPDMDSMNSFMRGRAERFLFYGHTHRPGVYTLENGKIAVNLPAVGKPKHGDYLAGYCVVEIASGKLRGLEFCFVDYDVQFVRKEITDRGFPKETLQFLL